MNITAVYNEKTKYWTAYLTCDEYKDNKTSNRVGCAIRDVLNKFEYEWGKPEGQLTITIEGW